MKILCIKKANWVFALERNIHKSISGCYNAGCNVQQEAQEKREIKIIISEN